VTRASQLIEDHGNCIEDMSSSELAECLREINELLEFDPGEKLSALNETRGDVSATPPLLHSASKLSIKLIFSAFFFLLFIT
jgi:hypothetical protein